MRAVQQHDTAEVGRCFCGVDLALEPVFVKLGQQPGMVDMCVGQKDIIDCCGRNGYFLILVNIMPLFHATVQQDMLSAAFDVVAAACYLVVRS
jgi:hypothetical protein